MDRRALQTLILFLRYFSVAVVAIETNAVHHRAAVLVNGKLVYNN